MKINYSSLTGRLVPMVRAAAGAVNRLEIDGHKREAESVRSLIRSRINSQAQNRQATDQLKIALARVRELETQVSIYRSGRTPAGHLQKGINT